MTPPASRWAPQPAAPVTAATSPDANGTIGLLAGLAWIGAALCIGYLAFLQLQYSSLVGIGNDLSGLALISPS